MLKNECGNNAETIEMYKLKVRTLEASNRLMEDEIERLRISQRKLLELYKKRIAELKAYKGKSLFDRIFNW